MGRRFFFADSEHATDIVEDDEGLKFDTVEGCLQ